MVKITFFLYSDGVDEVDVTQPNYLYLHDVTDCTAATELVD